MATRVAIYARVSTDYKGQDPENQLRQLRVWCERMGYPVVREYVEHENGGKGVEHRKALAQVFAGARTMRGVGGVGSRDLALCRRSRRGHRPQPVWP